MSDTLVLNRSYYAVHIMPWQRSISLLFQGHAEALDESMRTYNFDDWKELSAMMTEHPSGFVHSVNYQIAIPEVIRLTRYDRLPDKSVKFTRRNIYEHYSYKCCYCGKRYGTKDLNLDHVMPKSKGGPTNWTNIVTACIDCNTRKTDRTPAEAGMHLLVTPTQPKWKGPKMLMKFSLTRKASWQKLIDQRYWQSELEQSQ